MKKNTAKLANDALTKGVRFGFIPHNLNIENRHELDVFPLNVMFAKQKERQTGGIISAYSLYEPLINTYTMNGRTASMEYINIYSHNSHLLITYDYIKKTYTGDKFVGGKLVGSGSGLDWKTFFIHLTMLGLSNGERCKFD